MKINKIIKILGVSMFMLILNACTEDFETINTPPNSVTSIDPNFVFARALKEGAYPGPGFAYWKTHQLQYGAWVQHWGNHIKGFITASYQSNPEFDNGFWDSNYFTLKNLFKVRDDLLNNDTEDPESRTRIGMTLIQEIMLWDKLTAALGDVPYSGAITTEEDVNTTPLYDRQEDIYTNPENGLIARIDAAKALLNEGDRTFGGSDYYYQGNVDSWKRLANSIKLRLGMRLTKVAPQVAQQVVSEAMGTPLMEIQSHTAAVPTAGGNPDIFEAHPLIELKRRSQGQMPYLGEFLVDIMKAKNDPRLTLFGDPSVNSQALAEENNDPALLEWRGIPAALTPEQYESLDRNNYSFPSAGFLLNEEIGRSMPVFTYAEVVFLKAEAALRGWGANSSEAEGFLQKGIRAELERLQNIDGSGLTDQQIDDYVAAEGVLDGADFEENLEIIINHKWLALFERNVEAFLNWRRTGYPDIQPGDAQGDTGGQIPRRGKYSTGEAALNKINYDQVLSIQGADKFMTRVWLDPDN